MIESLLNEDASLASAIFSAASLPLTVVSQVTPQAPQLSVVMPACTSMAFMPNRSYFAAASDLRRSRGTSSGSLHSRMGTEHLPG